MKLRIVFGVMVAAAIVGASVPAAAHGYAPSWKRAGWSHQKNGKKVAATVTITPTLNAAKTAIDVRVRYSAEHKADKSAHDGQKIRAIELYLNNTIRQVKHIDPSVAGDVVMTIPLGSLTDSERQHLLKLQAKAYAKYQQPNGAHAPKTKLAAQSAIAIFRAPIIPPTPSVQVTWTPNLISLSGLAGTKSGDSAVGVAGSAKVDKASFRVTGAVKDMVAVGQDGLVDLNAHTVYNVSLGLKIAANKPAGVYKGALDLLQQGVVVSSVPVQVTVTAASASVVPQTTSSAIDERLVQTGNTKTVKDQLTVGLDTSVANPDQRIMQVAAQTGAVIMGSVPGTSTYQLRFTANNVAQLEVFRGQLKTLPGVAFVSLGVLGQFAGVPNDPGYTAGSWDGTESDDRNWGLKYIKAPDAWDTTTGSIGTRIGIVDGGFYTEHDDLKAMIVQARGFSVTSRFGGVHGNHVSGIACASGGNGKGIAGVNWRCSLGMYAPPDLEAINVMEKMKHAAMDDMHIVNVSLGWDGNNCVSNPSQADLNQNIKDSNEANPVVQKAMQWAKDNDKDVLWVFSAGNSCRDVQYNAPANLTATWPNAIAVAAVQKGGTKMHESNYGAGVTVAAPGKDIFSTMEHRPSGSVYGSLSGTSQAAPFVSGIAGLVRSAHPNFTAEQIKKCIVDAATMPVPQHTFKGVDASRATSCMPPSPEQCVFYPGSATACGSTNPTVVLQRGSASNSESCSYAVHVIWGDGTVQDYSFPGQSVASPNFITYGSHTYVKPGSYKVELTGTAQGGFFCSITPAVSHVFQFMLP